MSPPFILTWRQAVLTESGPTSPTTRLVLLVLASYMDEDGVCFPATATVATATALTERSVCTHLDLARRDGWIASRTRGTSGQGWRRMEYRATLPKALNVVQCEGTEPDSARSGEGTERRSKKALKDVQSNIPPEHPTLTDARFEEAWAAYPKRPNNSKAAAKKQWDARVKSGADPAVMVEGTRRYAEYVAAEKIEPRFVKMASTFYGPGEHWASDYDTNTTTGRSAGERSLYLRPSDMPRP